MTYRLPSAWNPGFALPGNIAAEGLQRRAFVTRQARRGTYDDPAVGDAGYAVPQYVKDENYGQGVFTSSWLPSGSTPGGHVPDYLNQRPQTVAAVPVAGGTKFTVAVPTGAVPVAYQNYGRKVASIVLTKLAKVPPSARPQQLKTALDGIDRKLHPRAMAAARVTGNLHAGLAHAFGATLLEQVIETGRTGRKPRKGLMGLAGCVSGGSRSAMGALPIMAGNKFTGAGAGAIAIPSIQPGQCEATGTYIWDPGDQTHAPHWRRRLAGETCPSINQFYTAPSVGGGGAQGGVTITDANGKVVTQSPNGPFKGLSPVITPGTTKLIKVGPFTFPLVDQMNIHWSGPLPDDWRAAINKQITRDCSPCISSSMRSAGPNTPYAILRQFLGPEMPSVINHDFFGINPGGTVLTSGVDPQTASLVKQVTSDMRAPSQPIAKTTRPDTGDVYGLYATVEPRDSSKPFNATSNPWTLRITWRQADNSVWGWIWSVLSTIVDWAGDAISAIGSLTCDILSNPLGQAGAIAGGAAVGGAGGAKAGATGAAVGAQLCAQPPPTAIDQPGSGLGPIILIGAGVAAAALLITSKKKKAP